MEIPNGVGPTAPFPCVNCKTPVKSNEAQIFQGVFLCPSCHMTATRLFSRLQADLRQLLTMAAEAIRVSLVEGTLHLGEYQHQEVPKEDLLRSLQDIISKRASNDPRSSARTRDSEVPALHAAAPGEAVLDRDRGGVP